jgi:hypothetical protein
MSNQPIESRTSNALGVRIPQWIIRQLNKRSEQLSVENQNDATINKNVLFRGNRSAWVRMVSSVDIIDPFRISFDSSLKFPKYEKLGENKAKRYFQDLGIDIKNPNDLAKKFVLQGGTAVYKNENNNFSYNLREGFPDTYNVAGNEEVKNYGYRPMPGITSVRVQTQGKLGSIRAAEIQLKVWDKAQLDIIDALYFKLGYTMFLEWGHTNYYKENGEFDSTERYSLDPFQAGLTKEDIYNKVSNSIRESEGNYDAMLGMVTNFNFSYNQEGGYDCTIKLISLGVLISNMKMNNPRVLPELQESVIRRLVDTLTALEKQRIAKERAAALQSELAEENSSYLPCVRKRGTRVNVKEKDTNNKRLEDKALNIVINNVSYYFYPSKKYQTTGFSTSGTYDCQGDEILIDGINENLSKKTYEQIIKANEKSIGYLYAPYSVNEPISVLENGTQLVRLRGSQNLNKSYAYEIKVGSGEYLAFNKFKSLIPKVRQTDSIDKFNIQAKIKLPSFVVYENVKVLALSPAPTAQGFQTFGVDNTPKVSVQKKSVDLLTQVRNVGTLYGQNPIRFQGSTATINEIIDEGTNEFHTNAYQKYNIYYKSYIQYSNQIGANELQDYLILFSYSSKAISSDGKQISTSPQSITLGSDQDKIRQKILETLNNSEEIWQVVNISNTSIPFPYSNLNKSIPKILITLEKTISVLLETKVEVDAGINPTTGQPLKKTETKNVEYKVVLRIDTTDTGIISGIDVKTNLGFTIIDAQTLSNQQTAQNTGETVEEAAPALNANDIQKTEAEKYKSAFEVIIRTIQLYSLDNAIISNIETDHVVKKLSFIQKDKANKEFSNTYKEFTKELFSSGLFANMLEDLYSMSKGGNDVVARCLRYDEQMKTGTVNDKEEMLRIRALFGFHFGLLGNTATAEYLLKGNLSVNFSELMSSYTVPYEFNQGIVQGTQLNHPVYIPLGFVIMILNHMCTIYDNNKPVVYLDFNHKSNICLSNAKHLSTNPYDVLIPFQGSNKDFESILEPTTLATENKKENTTGKTISSIVIKPMSGSSDYSPVYTPRNPDTSENAIRDRISGGLLAFKPNEIKDEVYRGRTMNILISCDYLLRSVGTFTKNNGSGDVYVREFIEQILSDINKSLGDINVFRLAYDDGANAIHVVDDQMTQNLEGDYPVANETFRDVENKSRLPLFGKGSIAKTLEIRTEVSSKLSNMIAVSANANIEDQANLSKSTDSFGFYNTSYKDRYIPNRTEYTSQVTLPTDTMIRSTIQFNEAIKTFYGDAKPAEGSVGHATNYYIQRMSKIKSSEKGTRAAAMIPVSLNFSMDGMSGFGMGQSFTVDPEFLPYTYDLSLTDPYGEQDRDRTVAFVMTGLDHTIEGNQWTSNVRTNMIYAKNQNDFNAEKIKELDAPIGLRFSESGLVSLGGATYLPDTVKKSKTFQEFIAQPGVKQKVESIAAEIGVKPDDLYIIFKAESGFNHQIENSIGAVGLIQFLPSTAEGLGTTTTALKNMPVLEQLDYVRKYFINRKGQYKNAYDLYMQTFFPLALGKPANFVIQTSKQSAELISSKNPGIAKAAGKKPGDPLTVADFYKYVASLLG